MASFSHDDLPERTADDLPAEQPRVYLSLILRDADVYRRLNTGWFAQITAIDELHERLYTDPAMADWITRDRHGDLFVPADRANDVASYANKLLDTFFRGHRDGSPVDKRKTDGTPP